MSRLFYQQGLMRQSLLYSDKEEFSSLQGKDTLNALRGMVGKVAPYKNLMLVDSAIYFCEKASNLAYKYGDRQIIKDYLVKGYAVNERIRPGSGYLAAH